MNSKKAERKKLVRLRRQTNPDYTLRPSNTRLREHLTDLNSVLSIAEIARRSGVPEATIHGQLKGTRGHTKCLMSTAQALMRVRLTDEERAEHMTHEQRALGGYRIVQGLMAMGWLQERIGQECGLTVHMIRAAARKPHERNYYQLGKASYARLRDAAYRLEPLDPVLDGKCDQRQSRNARSRALGRGAVPIAMWDLETVHLADANPEWTGACGTLEGRLIHDREAIPVCEPCRKIGEGSTEGEPVFAPMNLRIAIEDSGMTASELARQSGVTVDSIRRWTYGERPPSQKKLSLIADVLDLDLSDFYQSSSDRIYLDRDFNREKFFDVLDKKSITIPALASELGITDTAIYNWRRGEATPRIPKVASAARVLGMDWKEFYS